MYEGLQGGIRGGEEELCGVALDDGVQFGGWDQRSGRATQAFVGRGMSRAIGKKEGAGAYLAACRRGRLSAAPLAVGESAMACLRRREEWRSGEEEQRRRRAEARMSMLQ